MNPNQRRLKGFEQHGVSFSGGDESNAVGDCPFCGRDKKFYAHREEGVWQCWTCSRSGNFESFLKLRAEDYRQAFKGSIVKTLSVDRGLKPRTLKAWGVGWSGEFYSIPLRGNPTRQVTDIKRYTIGGKALATTSGHLSLATPLELRGGDRIWLCEGEWDAMALWEMLEAVGIKDEVWSTPGAASFPKRSVDMFYDREVVVAFDNDEAGQKGALKVASKLEGFARSVKYIRWPNGLPDGFDVRDMYQAHENDAHKAFDAILEAVSDRPMLLEMAVAVADMIEEEPEPTDAPLILTPGEVEGRFKKWLSMANTDCLDVMFGVVFANRLQGDPLWLMLVAPPGGMKTELLLSLSSSRNIHTTTTLTPQSLISGCNVGGGDPSLIPKLDGKVLVIKDLTTILEMNSIQRDEIFGILRDAYDGKIEKTFGNGITRKYYSHFGLLAGVTPAIESVSRSNVTLGERFLKYKVRAAATVNRGAAAIKQALRNIKHNDSMRKDLINTAYEVTRREVRDSEIPDLTDEMEDRFVFLAQWVAMLRGVVDRERYTGRVNFKPMTEVGTRLAKQFCKLAYGISIYRNEDYISERTYRIVATVAQDTTPDRVEEVVKQMYIDDPGGYKTTKEISARTKFPESTVRFLLQDMVLLNILEREPGRKGRWRLTSDMVEIMNYLKLYQRKPRRRKRRK